MNRGVFPPADVGVHRRGVHRSHDALRRSGAVHPTEEAWVGVADAKRQHVALDRGAHFGQRRRVPWQRVPARAWRWRLPGRSFPDRGHGVDRLVESPMRESTKGFPIGWIEAVVRLGHGLAGPYPLFP